MSISDLQSLLPNVVTLAQEAGAAIMKVYQKADIETTYKDDRSPLTEADLASHQIISIGLNQLTPDIPVLSEESRQVSLAMRQTWTRFWLVDPLDGTKEFIKRNGQFTVNIALVNQGVPELGVVFAPDLDTIYWAAQGMGAYKQIADQTPSLLQVRSYPEADLKVVASRSHAGPETEAFLAKLKTVCESVTALSMGSSLKICLVAEGTAHLYPRFGPTMEWDTGAAQCVLEQAGGQLTDLNAIPLRYNKDELLNPFFIACTQDAATLWPTLVDQPATA